MPTDAFLSGHRARQREAGQSGAAASWPHTGVEPTSHDTTGALGCCFKTMPSPRRRGHHKGVSHGWHFTPTYLGTIELQLYHSERFRKEHMMHCPCIVLRFCWRRNNKLRIFTPKLQIFLESKGTIVRNNPHFSLCFFVFFLSFKPSTSMENWGRFTYLKKQNRERISISNKLPSLNW